MKEPNNQVTYEKFVSKKYARKINQRLVQALIKAVLSLNWRNIPFFPVLWIHSMGRTVGWVSYLQNWITFKRSQWQRNLKSRLALKRTTLQSNFIWDWMSMALATKRQKYKMQKSYVIRIRGQNLVVPIHTHTYGNEGVEWMVRFLAQDKNHLRQRHEEKEEKKRSSTEIMSRAT